MGRKGKRMSDLISRQAVLNLAKDLVVPTKDGEYRHRCIDPDDVRELPSAQPEQQWIPATERLPEKYIGEWLCCTDEGEIMILPYDTPGDGSKECVFYQWDNGGYFYQTFNVVAWMPLPEPWKGDTE